ncbi:MAG: hypothetical protein ABI222_17910, partial [Opitutaceae bacterium]
MRRLRPPLVWLRRTVRDLALAGFLLLPGMADAAGSSGTIASEVREGLPPYDPKAGQPDSAVVHRSARLAGAPRPRIDPNQARAAPDPRTAPSLALTPVKPEPVITLPLFMVRGRPDPTPPAPLPRIMPRQFQGKDDKSDHTFETPAARDERLIRKHLSGLDRLFLNRFSLTGGSGVAGMASRAHQLEAIEQSTGQLND